MKKSFLQKIGQIYRIYLVPFSLFLGLTIASDLHAQNVSQTAYNFGVFVRQDLTIKPNEFEGAAAAGGNVHVNDGNVQIKPIAGAPFFTYGGANIGLAVRGTVNVSSGSELKIDGANFNGQTVTFYTKIGNQNGLIAKYFQGNSVIDIDKNNSGNIRLNNPPPGVSASNNPVFENIFGSGPGQIDIDGSFAKFEAWSAFLGTLGEPTANIVSARNQDNASQVVSGPFTSKPFDKPRFILQPDRLNVLTVSASVWSSFNEIDFEGFSTHPNFALIINFVGVGNGSTINFVNNRIEGDISKIERIILNFPEITTPGFTFYVQGMVRGTILAPYANVNKKANQNILGAVIANSYVHVGDEFHHHPFKVNIPEPPAPPVHEIYLDASSICLLDAPYLVYEVTGNFDLSGLKAKIEWLAPDGTVIHVDDDQPLEGQILFPGAGVDVNGNGNAWPGWKYENGNWIEDPTDPNAELRKPGAMVRITVNPEVTATITYPPSTTDCFTSPPPSTPPTLPVKLATFAVAEGENQSVDLRWVATDAVDFSHFEVERSFNGFEFVQVAKVDFKENIANYHYNDAPGLASTLYYRLKLVDLDGSHMYSKVESLVLKRAALSYGHPNPFSSKLHFYSPVRQGASVYDMTGRLITTLKLDEGSNEINAQSWATGLYLIRTDSRETVKVLKQ